MQIAPTISEEPGPTSVILNHASVILNDTSVILNDTFVILNEVKNLLQSHPTCK